MKYHFQNKSIIYRRLRKPLLHLPVCFVCCLLWSCAPRGVEVNPPIKLPEKFSIEGNANLPDKWWLAFNDAKLNTLIQEALRGNFSLRTAWARLEQARAVAAKSGSPLLPSVEGSAGVSRTVQKFAGFPRFYSTEYSLGISASYELDLWGRVRSAYDAARLDAYATQQDLQTAAITLSAEVARAWYRLIEQRKQLRLLDEQLQTNEKYLDIITAKFRKGQASATDVLQQRQLVESTKAERFLVEASIKVLESQLAVLTGQNPVNFSLEVPETLPELPPLPQPGLPAELIRRRPDVRAAELRLQAADRRVREAIANQFPKLGLTISAETTDEQIRNLFDNWLASIAANLVAPLFDAGQRRAEVKRTKAVVSERLNSYGQVVLTALKEVEDALQQESKQAQYVWSLKRQMETSDKATRQTLLNYTKGAVDFTRYLTTLLSHQQLQRKYLTARRDRILYRIDLYRALAGGWELPPPPRAKLTSKLQSVKNSSPTPKSNTTSLKRD